EQAEQGAKYNLPYGGLVKAVAKSSKQIKSLENKPEELRNAMRAKLEEEFADLVEAGMFDERNITAREMYISKKLVEYMSDPAGEYHKVKEELQQARNDYAIYLAKKEEWEQENADIINAERIRTKRAELMQADPEALRALGIEPDPVSTPVAGSASGADADDGKGALREALRSIHPSASDAEIESMVKLV
ncbi:MAG: hypothetical protein ACI4FZ_04470, partial [Lachnospiraceae bacterium]